MNVVIAPDSFKGSLTAAQAAQACAAGVRRALPLAEIVLQPMADGGEGTLAVCLDGAGGERRCACVEGADGRPRLAFWGVLGDAALIEAAQAVGWTAATVDVASRSSRGVGQLLRAALDQGFRRILVALGGTSTNDGGAGLLSALGVRFLDASGEPVAPTPAGLSRLVRVDVSRLDARVLEAEIVVMTDVDNPLTGPTGATWVFGPQKGVRAEDLPVFDARLAHLAECLDAAGGRARAQTPGAGAAGGLGHALMWLGGVRRAGAEVVAEIVDLPARLRGADWVITGEGKSDAQTLHGKLPLVVARIAHGLSVRVALVSGHIERAVWQELFAHFDLVAQATPDALPLARALSEAAKWLEEAAFRVALGWKEKDR